MFGMMVPPAADPVTPPRPAMGDAGAGPSATPSTGGYSDEVAGLMVMGNTSTPGKLGQLPHSGSISLDEIGMEAKSSLREAMAMERTVLVDNISSEIQKLSEKMAYQGGASPEMHAPEMQDFSLAVGDSVAQAMSKLEGRLEAMLDGMVGIVSEDLQREQEHLILMQDQVDKQSQLLQKVLPDLQKKMEQEKSQRSYVQRSVRDQKELVDEELQAQKREVELLRARMEQLEGGGLYRALSSALSYVLFPCWGGAVAGGGYTPVQEARPAAVST